MKAIRLLAPTPNALDLKVSLHPVPMPGANEVLV
jgi:hypothetical protein